MSSHGGTSRCQCSLYIGPGSSLGTLLFQSLSDDVFVVLLHRSGPAGANTCRRVSFLFCSSTSLKSFSMLLNVYEASR